MEDQIAGFRLSPQQRRVWWLLRDSDAYRVQCAIELYGPLEPNRLREAIRQVVDRHEILGTRFQRQAGIRFPLQVIGGAAGPRWREMDLADLESHSGTSRFDHFLERERLRAFDLSNGPLLHVVLISVAEERHRLVLTLPSLVADFRTLRNLAAEISRFYAMGEQPAGEPLQYVQFSEWQNELRDDADAEEAQQGRAYWERVTEGHASGSDLPFQKSATEPGPYRPEQCQLTLDSTIVEHLAGACEAPGATVLLAAWQALLWRHTEDSAVSVSTVLANRENEDLQGVMGLLATRVPIRCRLTGRENLAQVVGKTREAVLEASEWQEFFAPQEDGEAVDLPGDYPVSFEVEHWQGIPAAGGVEFALHDCSSCFDRSKLHLSCLRAGDRWLAVLRWDPLVFSGDDIGRLVSRFETLLGSAVEAPRTEIGQLTILSTEERRYLLEELNQTAAVFPHERCLHQLLAEQASRVPERIAVAFEDQQLTFGELDRRAQRLAGYLDGLGVAPEELVAIYFGRSVELLVAILGVLKAGGAYVALDVDQPRGRLTQILEDAAPRVLLTRELLIATLPPCQARVLPLDTDWRAIAESDGETTSRAAPHNLAYVCYTSGSSGRPKGVMVPHQGVVNYLSWCAEAYGVAQGRGSTVHSPLGFDLTVTSLFAPLMVGKCVRLVSEEQGIDVLGSTLASESGFSLVKITPAHLEVLAQSLAREELAGRTRVLVLGGDALFWENLSEWRQRAPRTRLINEYGPTETVVGCCVYEVSDEAPQTGPVPIGLPIANTQVYLLDRKGRPVPVGMAGELWVGGTGVARGYLKRPATTAASFLPAPFARQAGARLYRTGDFARLLPDSGLVFLGRRDDQVKIRGARIEPGEVEAVLLSHPGVREGVVAVREEGGERLLVAYGIATGEPPVAEVLRAFLAEQLPEYMVPTVFVWLDSLPLTIRGKVDRRRLPAPGSDRPELSSVYQAPRTVAEEILADIWQEVLRIDTVGIHDSFFALGGDSIRSVRVVALAKQKGLHFTVQQLFMNRTIAELVDVAETTADSLVGVEAEEAKLAELISELEGVSEEEVKDRLREKMELARPKE